MDSRTYSNKNVKIKSVSIRNSPTMVNEDDEEYDNAMTLKSVTNNSRVLFKRSSGELGQNTNSDKVAADASFSCENCNELSENINKASSIVISYIETLLEHVNSVYHKTTVLSNPLLSIDYHNSIAYDQIDKVEIGNDLNLKFKNIVVSD